MSKPLQKLTDVTSAGDRVEALAIEHYVAIWQERIRTEQVRADRLARLANEDARQIAVMLRDQFSATWVILFGSLVSGRFGPGSDIDLAVAGIPKAEFFRALAEANMLAEVWVDLKPLEDLDPHFLRRVLETGEDLLSTGLDRSQPDN